MAASSKIPLYLFQVLEEEYVALHGEELNDLDWQFAATHIQNAAALIAELGLTSARQGPAPQTNQTPAAKQIEPAQSTAYAAADPEQLAMNALRKYLRDELKKKELGPASSDEELAAKALNTFLDDKNFFNEERFSQYWLSDATRSLRDVRDSLSDDDHRHFNRLLLEDAFPDYLEKIHRIRLADIYQRIHKKQQTALCLSGGGIRSGTFALGLLQGLARHKLLDQFHYLSTVSGGGYIGSWLAAWIHRHPQGVEGVTKELANTSPPTKVDPDPPPIRYLRRYSSFITPKVGLLTADTWTFIAIYLRNLLLNWIVLIPLLLGVLTLPRIIVAVTLAPTTQTEPWFSIPTPWRNFDIFGRHLFLFAGLLLVSWALAYIMFNRPTVREELRQSSKRWRGKSTQRSFLYACLLPLSLAAFCLTTYWAWSSQNQRLPKNVFWFLIFGFVATLIGWLISCWVLGRIRLTLDSLRLVGSGVIGGLLLWLVTVAFDPFGGGGVWDCRSVAKNWPWRTLTTEIYACLATPVFLLVFLLGVTLYIGLTSKPLHIGTSKTPTIDDEDREWWARLSAWVLIVILGWTVFTSLVIFGPIALLSAPKTLGSLGSLSGLIAILAGRSAKTPGGSKAANQEEPKSGLLNALMGKALPLLAMIFIGVLLVSLSLATTGIIRGIAYNLPGFVSRYSTSTPLGVNEFLNCGYSILHDQPRAVKAQFAHLAILHLTSFWFVFILGVVLFYAGLLISLLVNLNIFSLHGGYRNRLIRAFLGASRPDHQRKPNPFTGFDPADNISMHELRPGLFDEDDFPRAVDLTNVLLNYDDPAVSKTYPDAATAVAKYLDEHDFLRNLDNITDPKTFSIKLLTALRKDLNGALEDPSLHKDLSRLAPAQNGSAKSSNHIYLNRRILDNAFDGLIEPLSEEPRSYKLMPVISTTLNLVGGDNLAWQQRKAEPFSVSPLYSGCFRLGYRDSRFYGGRDTGGISIGTAAAISGAAASSNMGYYTTSPVLSLVLTFFNVRLGWWLGNPGTAGNGTYDRPAPVSSVGPVLDEALGLTDDKNKYVYLTDGGHFENLGLYEMVLRRCHIIVVSDAAADGEYRFGDLGNAIRKVRIDLGIPIEFTAMPIFRFEPGETRKGMYWAVGHIRYSCIDGAGTDGVLLYIKPAVYGNEPRDVLEYKKSHPTFPHQSTADQFFDEPQFESYRILGSYIMDQMCGLDNKPLQLNQALDKAVAKLLDPRDRGPADPLLKDWWEKLFPPSASKASQFWSLMRN